MYLYATYEGDKAPIFAVRQPPNGIGVRDAGTLYLVKRIEHWASSFNDEGEDFNEFRLFDQNDNLIEKIRLKGY